MSSRTAAPVACRVAKSELLGSAHAQEVVTDLRSRFDYVIIDAPPLLPVTDAAILTRIADGALLIARYGKTTREQFARAIGNLQAVNATVLGTILTMVPAKGRGASYEYRYYYDADKAQTKVPAPRQAVEDPVVPGPNAASPPPPAPGNGRTLTGPVPAAGRHSDDSRPPSEPRPVFQAPQRPAPGSGPNSSEQG